MFYHKYNRLYFYSQDYEAVDYARSLIINEGLAVGLASGAAICDGIKLGLIY